MFFGERAGRAFMWATHGPFICLNTLAFPQSVLYHAGHPKERIAHMNDAPKTEAQEAVSALLVEYDLSVSPTLYRLLTVAYARGARIAASEAAAVTRVPVVFDVESDSPRALGTYAGSEEDAVMYEASDTRIVSAPQDCVKVVDVSVPVP